MAGGITSKSLDAVQRAGELLVERGAPGRLALRLHAARHSRAARPAARAARGVARDVRALRIHSPGTNPWRTCRASSAACWARPRRNATKAIRAILAQRFLPLKSGTFLLSRVRKIRNVPISLVDRRAGGQDRPTTMKDGSMRQFRCHRGVQRWCALLVACGGGSDVGPPVSGGTAHRRTAATRRARRRSRPIIAARFGVVELPRGRGHRARCPLTNADRDVLLKHFSSITAENVMKPDTIWPNAPGTSGSTAQPATSRTSCPADTARELRRSTTASSCAATRCCGTRRRPSWFFAGDHSNPVNYRINVQQRLRDYIFAVVQHFPNVYAWDVVNEVASDTPNSANPYRTDSPWYRPTASAATTAPNTCATPSCSPTRRARPSARNSANMKLMLNDYNTELPGKRANVIADRAATSSTPASPSTASATSSTCSSTRMSAR